MDASSEIKSKYFALAATIGLHTILFAFFFMIVFIKQEKSISKVLTECPDVLKLGISFDEGLSPSKFTELKPSMNKPTSAFSQNENDLINRVTDHTETNVYAERELQDVLNKLKKIKVSGEKINSNVTATTDNKESGNANNEKNIQSSVTSPYILSGRELIRKPLTLNDSKEEGKVAVEIFVDEKGNVVNAITGQRGSTTANATLLAKARQMALQLKFNPSPEGIKEQKGTYTFVFTLE